MNKKNIQVTGLTIRDGYYVADIEILDYSLLISLFKNLCCKHRLDFLMDSIIYIAYAYIPFDLSNVTLKLFVEEEDRDLQSEYTASFSEEEKEQMIKTIMNYFSARKSA